MRYVGGRSVTGLFISDVRWDDPAVIGSGLLASGGEVQESADPGNLPDWLLELMAAGKPERPTATPQPVLQVVATLRDAREGAAQAARALGYETMVSHAFINAGAENVGRRLALELLDSRPGVYIWGVNPVSGFPGSRDGVGATNIWHSLWPASSTVLMTSSFFPLALMGPMVPERRPVHWSTALP